MKPLSMQPDEKPNYPSLAIDIPGPSSELATSTLTLSADHTVSLVPASAANNGAATASAAAASNQLTVSPRCRSLHVY